MKVKQCRMCGKLFQSLGNPICPECVDLMDQQFREVRDYLYRHPNADIAEIVKETGVSERSILQFLREERLSLMNTSANVGIRCEQCGKPISSGKLCVDCKERLSKMFESKLEPKASEKPASTGSDTMSYQGRRHFDNNTR